MTHIDTEPLLEHREPPPVPAVLWFALFAGMAAFALEEQLSYVLTYNACSTGRLWLVHLVTAFTLGLAGLGLFLGYAELRSVPDEKEKGRYLGRTRFLAVSAIALDIGFMIVIIATAVPKAILSPCQ